MPAPVDLNGTPALLLRHFDALATQALKQGDSADPIAAGQCGLFAEKPLRLLGGHNRTPVNIGRDLAIDVAAFLECIERPLLAGTAERGPLPVFLKYFGATRTGRWSGGDKTNWQNFPRTGELSRCISASRGFRLIICDMAQIEYRILCSVVRRLPLKDQLEAARALAYPEKETAE